MMMSNWRNELRPASFKGIKFEVLENTEDTGRRVHLHEYPNKNIPYAEDLGKRANLTNIEAFVIGDDFIKQKKELKDACSSAGAGTLVHPTYGNLEVICTGCVVLDSYKDGRVSKFSLSFVEAGEQALPSSTIDFKDQVSSKADAVEKNAIDSFLDDFNIVGKASAVANSAAGTATTFADKALGAIGLVNSKIGSVTSVGDTGLGAIDTITSVANEISGVSSNALNILKTPDVFSSRLSSCMMIVKNFLGPKEAIKQVKTMSSLGVAEQTEKINIKTEKGREQVEAMQQIEVLSQRVGLATQAKIIAAIEFDNTTDAQSLLDDFREQVEEQVLLEINNNDVVLQSLKDLQAVLVKDISNTIKKLPEIKQIELSEHIPATVLAYNLYEDVSRADEVSKRNRIIRPGFIPSNTKLEVLCK